MRGTLNVWLWKNQCLVIAIVQDQKKKRSTFVAIVRDEKKEEQLLVGSTKREQLFGMNKGRGSIRLLRHSSSNVAQRSPTTTC